MARFVLAAATLIATYGIYGPAFELLENRAREPGSEEYLDSEKYERRHWDLERSDSLQEFIRRVNRIRRENPALQRDGNLQFHRTDNVQLLCYSRQTDDRQNTLLIAVNLDPYHMQSGWIELSDALGFDFSHPYQVHDLLGGAAVSVGGSTELRPIGSCSNWRAVHISFCFGHRLRPKTPEQQFEYFM